MHKEYFGAHEYERWEIEQLAELFEQQGHEAVVTPDDELRGYVNMTVDFDSKAEADAVVEAVMVQAGYFEEAA